jgi:NAD(P)-dependent dehydrogenase (short-subunit alcohol dehydrogenase family)
MSTTFALGAAFLGLEAREFAGLIERGAGPTRSAFLEDIAAAIAFLASDDAAFATGTALRVDGGRLDRL